MRPSARRAQLQRRTTSSDSEQAIGGLRLTLGLLASATDGVFIGITAASQTAKQIIEIAQSVKKNKKDCQQLANDIDLITSALVEATAGRSEQDIGQDLKVDIESFSSTLQEIRSFMLRMAARGRFASVFNAVDASGEIIDYKQRLAQAASVFQIRNSISTRITVTALSAQIASQPIDDLILLSQPPPPPIFFGRDEVVADLVDLLLTQQPARFGIIGAGGMGKTSVAVATLHHPRIIAHFSASRFFVPCDTVTGAGGLITAMLKVCRVTPTQGNPLDAIMTFLRGSPHILLVLDNFETPMDDESSRHIVELILGSVASLSNVALLLTMRGIVLPRGVQWTAPQLSSLPVLDLEAARNTFLAICPVSDPPVLLDELLLDVGCIPLATTLLAHVAQGGDSVEVLLDRWREERTALLRTSSQGRLHNVDISISLSVHSTLVKSEDDALPLLSLISNLPAGVVSSEHLKKIAPSLQNCRAAAAVLRRASLAYQDSNGVLKVLPPIRHFMLQKHPSLPEHLSDLRNHYVALAKLGDTRPGQEGYKTALKVLSPEIPNITHVLVEAMRDMADAAEVVQAVVYMSPFMYYTYPHGDLYRAALKCKLHAPHTHLIAKCQQNLGNMHRMQSNYSEALANLHKATQAYLRMDGFLEGAHCLRSIGDIYRLQSNYSEATVHLTEAQKLFLKLGNSDGKSGAAQCLRSLGEIHSMQDIYETALTYLKEAMEHFIQLGQSHGAPRGVANCLQGLGDIYRKLSDWKEANDYLHKAREQFIHMEHPLAATQCLWSLGDIQRLTHQHSEAEKTLVEAKGQFQTSITVPVLPNVTSALELWPVHFNGILMLVHLLLMLETYGNLWKIGFTRSAVTTSWLNAPVMNKEPAPSEFGHDASRFGNSSRRLTKRSALL